MELDILRVKSGAEYDPIFKNIKAPLLKPPFLLVINGSVKTGKSTILMNLIYNKNFYKDMFDTVIFISPTVENDVTLKHLNEDEDILKLNPNDNLDESVKTIVDEKMDDEDEKLKNYLIVLDDCLGYIKPNSYFVYLCTRYRQRKISLIITSQSFRNIPNVIRVNATGYLLFKTLNNKELYKYIEEFSGLFKDFKKIYEEATKEPYNFLYLNLRNIEAYKNFSVKLD